VSDSSRVSPADACLHQEHQIQRTPLGSPALGSASVQQIYNEKVSVGNFAEFLSLKVPMSQHVQMQQLLALKVGPPQELTSFIMQRLESSQPKAAALSPSASGRKSPETPQSLDLATCLSILADLINLKSSNSESTRSTKDASRSANDSEDSSPNESSEAQALDGEQGSAGGKAGLKQVKSKTSIFRLLNHSPDNLRLNLPGYTAGAVLRMQEKAGAEARNRGEMKQKKVSESAFRPSAPGLQAEKCSDSKEASAQISQVLYIKGTDPAKVSIRDLCNLFSNYGNLEIGFLQTDKQFALIKYSSLAGSALGMKHLNRLMLHGKKLSIFYSHFGDIEETRYMNMKEFFVPDSSCRRFRSGVPAQANPVSRTLHICVFFTHKRRLVRDTEVLECIARVAAPIRIQRDSNKDNINMWFMEFADTQSAVEVLMKCHDEHFEDGNLRISFTKTRKANNAAVINPQPRSDAI
jgi:RNA recognition motif. (a.k.a. RRM, RBD, or RNP domain)